MLSNFNTLLLLIFLSACGLKTSLKAPKDANLPSLTQKYMLDQKKPDKAQKKKGN